MKISMEKTFLSEYYPDGIMRSCFLMEEIKLHTSCGILTPVYSREGQSTSTQPSLTFYKNGKIRTILLENRTDINTSIGIYPARLVIFHENGALKRFYPSGDKTVDGEAEKLSFSLSCGSFTAGIDSVSFYACGAVREVVLAPDEEVILNTNAGVLPVRLSFSLYENGNIKSAEPSHVLTVNTPVGSMELYDNTAGAGSTDIGSMQFNRSGEITSFRLSDTSLDIKTPGGNTLTVNPISRCENDSRIVVRRPLTVRLEDGSAVISGGQETVTVPISGASFVPVR